jgi:SAM-dependent methyltransferase
MAAGGPRAREGEGPIGSQFPPTDLVPPRVGSGDRVARSPGVPSFHTLDFQRLWSGRERVTEVESEILRTLLAEEPARRVLELGCGEGRLSLVAQERVGEYVAVDVTPQFLARVPVRDGVTARRIAANLYHLPFVDGAFSAAVLVRVYGFLEDPAAALAELRRVLAPGGRAIISYNPRPSVATVVDDLKVATHRRPGEAMHSMTFARAAVVRVRPSEFPAWSSTRRQFRDTVRVAGLEWRGELPSGLEEYRGFRTLPRRVFVRLAHAYRGVGGFPSQFAVVVRPRGPAKRFLPWSAIIACPACRAELSVPEGSATVVLSCGGCDRSWQITDGILDARWEDTGSLDVAIAPVE